MACKKGHNMRVTPIIGFQACILLQLYVSGLPWTCQDWSSTATWRHLRPPLLGSRDHSTASTNRRDNHDTTRAAGRVRTTERL